MKSKLPFSLWTQSIKMDFTNGCSSVFASLGFAFLSWTWNPITHSAPPLCQVTGTVTSDLKLLPEKLEFPKKRKFWLETNTYYLVCTCNSERSWCRDGFYALIAEECENFWSIALILEVEKAHIVYSVYK